MPRDVEHHMEEVHDGRVRNRGMVGLDPTHTQLPVQMRFAMEKLPVEQYEIYKTEYQTRLQDLVDLVARYREVLDRDLDLALHDTTRLEAELNAELQKTKRAEAKLEQVTRGAAPLSGVEVEEMEQGDEELW